MNQAFFFMLHLFFNPLFILARTDLSESRLILSPSHVGRTADFIWVPDREAV